MGATSGSVSTGREPHDVRVLHARMARGSSTPRRTTRGRTARPPPIAPAATSGRSTTTTSTRAPPTARDLRRLAGSPGYDAEARSRPTGGSLFTSMRDGDLDLYVMDADGGNARRLTDRPGYDGGPILLLGRPGHRLESLASDRGGRARGVPALLGRGLVRPSRAELFVMAADGTGARQITSNEGGELGAVSPPGRRADRLLVQPPRSGPVRLRAVSHPPRRARPRAAHLRGVVRVVPDVLGGRSPASCLARAAGRRNRASSTRLRGGLDGLAARRQSAARASDRGDCRPVVCAGRAQSAGAGPADVRICLTDDAAARIRNDDVRTLASGRGADRFRRWSSAGPRWSRRASLHTSTALR